MKKIFFASFIFFNLASIPDILKKFIKKEEEKKEEEKKNNTITKSSIEDRIKKFTEKINYTSLNTNDFSSKENIKQINEIIFNISDSNKQKEMLMEMHSLRRAIYLDKLQQKKEKMLSSLSDVNNLFLAYNAIPQLEILIHNYLFSFLLDQESLADAFLQKEKKDELQKNFEKIQFIFKDNGFLPLLMDLICTQINASGSYIFLQKEGNTIKIYDFHTQTVNSNIEFFTFEITKEYLNLYKKKNDIFIKKGSDFEGERQKYFTDIYKNIIKKLNIESKYPILYNAEILTEQEFFCQVLNQIMYSFAEQYIEDVPFNDNLLETLILIDNPKQHQKNYMNYIDILPKIKHTNSSSPPFFYNNAAKGNPYFKQSEVKENISQANEKQSKKKEQSKCSKIDYCIAGGTILLMAYIYIKQNTNS